VPGANAAGVTRALLEQDASAQLARRPSVYSLMDDSTLMRAVLELERTCSQPAMTSAPASIRTGYLDALDAARNELTRRKV